MRTDSTLNVNYSEPFAPGTLGSKTYRIPGLWTLNNGNVFAAADMRYDHGSDSPNNIDILFAKSEDGYKEWTYCKPNYFDDYADGVTDKGSASFIDSAVAQSSTGRIFVVSDVVPSGGGYWQAKPGSGFVEVGGKKHLLLTDAKHDDKLDSFGYYIGDFGDDGFAVVFDRKNNSATAYSVDRYFNLYKNSEMLYVSQVGSEAKIRQNVFYKASDLTCYLTTYLVLRTSDDNGETWNPPVLLSGHIKSEKEGFLGIGPGRGCVTTVDGKERVLFMVYDNVGKGPTVHNERVSTIYTDDDGVTWKRGERSRIRPFLIKTSESQTIDLGNGTLRMFARTQGRCVAYADSVDGGHSWTKFRSDFDMPSNGNCMISFINAEVNGKQFVLGSYTANKTKRANGVIRVGTLENGNIDWINTYYVNDGFFAYSCLTQLADGNIAMLYEDKPDKVSYMILTLDEEGNLSEINGNNLKSKPELPFAEKFNRGFFGIVDKIFKVFGLI